MDLILKDLDPRESYLKWFAANSDALPSGRHVDQLPQLSVVPRLITHANGSAMVKFGDTVVVCSVKCEVVEHDSLNDMKDYLVANLQFAPGARADIRNAPPSSEAQELTVNLAQILKKSGIIDWESLLVEDGALARVLYVDAVCLVDAGCAFEASLIAAVSSLANSTFECPRLDSEAGVVTVDAMLSKAPLEVACIPVALSFGFLSDSIMITCPTTEELVACNGSQALVVFDLLSGKVLSFQSKGSHLGDAELLSRLSSLIETYREQLKIFFN